jgi:hypothetical protein
MYVRLKFNAGVFGFNVLNNGRSPQEWIVRVLNNETAIDQLPSALFNIANCVKIGNIGSNNIATFSYNTGTVAASFNFNYFEIKKRHSQNANFESLFRVHQTNLGPIGPCPRYYSSNATNIQPSATSANSTYWHDTNATSNNYTQNLSEYEFQFFSSDHWFIWSALDVQGRGGTAGIFDVESTGQDTWAKNLNSLYSPQFYMSAHGQQWPASTILRQSESNAQQTQVATYSNLMYSGDIDFANRGSIHRGIIEMVRGNTPLPFIYPDVNISMYPTRDEIGDTQNFMVPVYFHTFPHQSTTIPANRSLLNGRVPFLWRTSDNAAQTGQKAVVGGTEYRFVRMHACGTVDTTNVNAATYMIPTSIGGL